MPSNLQQTVSTPQKTADEGYGQSLSNLAQDENQQISLDTIAVTVEKERERDTRNGSDTEDGDSNYSFVDSEDFDITPVSPLKRWGNVTLYQGEEICPKSHITDTKKIPEYVNSINPIKEWRKNHLKQLEKRLDLVLIEENEEDKGEIADPLHFVRSLDKRHLSNPSLDKISSSDSLIASSSCLGDIMEEDEDDVKSESEPEVRESVHSDITIGRLSATDSESKTEAAPIKSLNQKPSFIRGLLSRTKDAPEAIKSKIPIFQQKNSDNQESASKKNVNSSFKVLGGRSLSEGKPKTALLSRLYNIGKPKATISKEKESDFFGGAKDNVLDWKKANIFEDADDDEFDGDFNAIREMKRFLKKYKIVRQIGTGGHSTVRLATRLTDSAPVVAKFIHSSNVWHWNREGENQKTPLEISMMKIFSDIKLKNVIHYIEHYQVGERFIIIMEYLGDDWIDLYDFIELHGPVEESVATHIFKEVCETIQTMHSLGYSHNDIKDENVMINKKNLELKLIDFGSTVPLTSTPTTIFYGTQKFSSPEALCNQSYVLAEQEIWALGTLLYVLLFKMDPFANDEEIMDLDISIRMHALRTRSYGKNNPPIQISDDAAESIIQMLSKNPEDRPRVENLMELPIFHNQDSDDD